LNDPLTYIPVVLQDRTFTPTGELFFDALGLNPEHPFWVPEFVGNTIVINGKTWPKLDLAPGLYRFLFLNGSNARAYVITPKVFAKGKVAAPAMYAIATDGGYLDAPALIPNVTIMPGERYDDHGLEEYPGWRQVELRTPPDPSGRAGNWQHHW
jgi:FtsP/CotA-like multicopper oxidase with cupredoxin domain